MRNLLLFLVLFSLNLGAFEFKKEDKIVVLGGAFAECLIDSASLEYQIQKNNTGKNIKLRNMAWSGDTVYPQVFLPDSALRGGPQKRYWKDSKFNTSDRPYNFGTLEEHLKKEQPTVYFLFFGMSESFDGLSKLSDFKNAYENYLKRLRKVSPGARFVLFSPIKQEKVNQFYPEVEGRNKIIEKYCEVIKSLAAGNSGSYVDLFSSSFSQNLTHNGILPTIAGMDLLISKSVNQLVMKPHPVDNNVRKLLVAKNNSFFHRWRPLNLEYIVGTRSVHTSRVPVYLTNDKDYREDFSKHDQLISQYEAKVWKLCLQD